MQKQVTLDPGQSQRVSFLVSPISGGDYTFELDGLSGLFSAVATQHVVTFGASKDNYIINGLATNYGDSGYMIIGGREAPYSELCRKLIEFAINWGTDIPIGAHITSAELKLMYMRYEWENAVGRTLRAQRLLRLNWDEYSSGWFDYKSGSAWGSLGAGSSSSDYTTSGQANTIIPSSNWQWITWDLTAQVQWAQSNSKNVACRIAQASEDFDYSILLSTRDYVESCRPQLVCSYYV